MTVTAQQALARAHNQSINGPRFAVGMCKRKTRELYSVPSDGSGSAAEAWSRTRHRLAVDPDIAPPGALLWWIGGSDRNGHVAIKANTVGFCWSVDFKRGGFFDRVPIAEITRGWPLLKFAGVSADIDGVQVIPDLPKATSNIDHAIGDLERARDARKPGTRRRRRIREILAALRALKAGR